MFGSCGDDDDLDCLFNMTPSPRFAHPTNTTARPSRSTNIIPESLSNAQILPATPFDATIQQLSFNARVPVAGMQSSNYASDAMRTALHLPNSRVIDVDTLDEIEFDGISSSITNQTLP